MASRWVLPCFSTTSRRSWAGRESTWKICLCARRRAGYGVGRKVLAWLAAEVLKRECGRLEWAVLDWNEPSIQFYKNLGAVHMKEWQIFRVTGPALTRLARQRRACPK